MQRLAPPPLGPVVRLPGGAGSAVGRRPTAPITMPAHKWLARKIVAVTLLSSITVWLLIGLSDPQAVRRPPAPTPQSTPTGTIGLARPHP